MTFVCKCMGLDCLCKFVLKEMFARMEKHREEDGDGDVCGRSWSSLGGSALGLTLALAKRAADKVKRPTTLGSCAHVRSQTGLQLDALPLQQVTHHSLQPATKGTCVHPSQTLISTLHQLPRLVTTKIPSFTKQH